RSKIMQYHAHKERQQIPPGYGFEQADLVLYFLQFNLHCIEYRCVGFRFWQTAFASNQFPRNKYSAGDQDKATGLSERRIIPKEQIPAEKHNDKDARCDFGV